MDFSALNQTLDSWINTIARWFGRDFDPVPVAGQGLALVAAYLLAQFFARRSGKWADARFGQRQPGGFRIHAEWQEIFQLIYAVALFWAVTLLAQTAELPYRLLSIASSLFTAWAVIRFTSSAIESPFWSRLTALVLWTLAALNILRWLDPAVKLLDKAALTVGDARLSLLIVVKSLLAFGLLFWGVRLIARLMNAAFARAQGITPSQRVLFQKISVITLYTAAGLVGLNIVGIDLTALAVFSGALGLGVGFGLQKVLSNLISGIILLLDKSVKPGDVIVVAGTYGWVNSLGARCVSVITRDGKEHLIPNENLIAQEVENWSYSDRNVRVHIPIGVSYHSDVQQVKALLLQAAAEHKRVLKYPQPNCLIMGFGDNSIDFELRLWIMDPADGVSNLKSDLYFRIWELFKENGVEIPFPQRDVHLKSDLPPEALAALGAK